MAVFRIAPKCFRCGKSAEGVYLDQSNEPTNQQIIGDTFLYWKPINCKCEVKYETCPDCGSLLTSQTAQNVCNWCGYCVTIK